MKRIRQDKKWVGIGQILVFMLIGLIVILWGPGRYEVIPADSAETESISPRGEYMGSLICRECHGYFHELWETSFHGLAMQPFTAKLAEEKLTPQTEDIVIGDYRYRVDISGEQGWVNEYGPDGDKKYLIVHALGGKNVYYFLTPTERGRLQTLPVAYNVNTKQWFDTAASGVRHFSEQAEEDQPVHWTDPLYSFNTSCYGCHISQMVNNYDLETDTYNTVWVEPGINCETCHGPAVEHIKVWKDMPEGQVPEDQKIVRGGHNGRVKFTAEQQNSSCAPCHAKMSPLSNEFPPGDLFFNHYDLITLEHPDFYPDGRDLGENYTYTTWMMSPCVQASDLDCLFCHTSSGRYRFKDQEKANQACAPCHQERVDNPEPHTHHSSYLAEKGPKCISCHMPMTSFANMNRSDHSMRPPTPATSMEFDSPTACTICHIEKDAEWADQQVREWHEDDYQVPYLYQAHLVDAARKEDWSRLPEMLAYLQRDDRDTVVTNSLVRLLRACLDERKWPVILKFLQDDPSPLVRASAAVALEEFLTPETAEALVKATRDEFRLVRVRAAGSLASIPPEYLDEQGRQDVEKALDEYVASIIARPDDYASHYNLGNLFMDMRDFEKAIAAYETSVRLRPDFVLPLVNASFAFNAMGQNARAEANLQDALKLEPDSAVVNLNLGLLLGEQGRLQEAEAALRNALKADPTSAVAAFNLGILLSKDRLDEGIVWLQKAAALRPTDPKYVYTLAYFLRQNGNTDKATTMLQELIQQQPGYGDAYGLLGGIYEELRQIEEAKAIYQKGIEAEGLSARYKSFLMGHLKALSSN